MPSERKVILKPIKDARALKVIIPLHSSYSEANITFIRQFAFTNNIDVRFMVINDSSKVVPDWIVRDDMVLINAKVDSKRDNILPGLAEEFIKSDADFLFTVMTSCSQLVLNVANIVNADFKLGTGDIKNQSVFDLCLKLPHDFDTNLLASEFTKRLEVLLGGCSN